MLDIIEVTNTIESVGAEFPPTTTESQNELGEQITNLWVAHANAKMAARATRGELCALRARLGAHLSTMKDLLAKPGRGGQWSSFLQEKGIPRATADRLVIRYQNSLNPEANRLTEADTEPTQEEVRRLFTSVWPKLRRTLRSQQSLHLFVELLTTSCEHSKLTDQELPVVTPPPATFGPASLDGDSIREPESCSAPLPGPDRATICAS
jgi:hypothetical protein